MRTRTPIDPVKVQVGQVIEVETKTWLVSGRVVAVDPKAREVRGARYIAIGNGDDFTVWPKLDGSVVWLIEDNPRRES